MRKMWEEATGITLPDSRNKAVEIVRNGGKSVVNNAPFQSYIDNAATTDYTNINNTVKGDIASAERTDGRGGIENPQDGMGGLRGYVDGLPEGRRETGEGTQYSGVVRLTDETQNALKKRGIVTFELKNSDSDTAAFSRSLDEARTSDARNGWAVTPKTSDDVASLKTIMSADNKAGLAVSSDGDIEAVFKNPNGGPKGALNTLIPAAIEAGGTKLDCYGEDLARLYARYGFVPVASVEFNPEYANEGWTPDKGEPRIYFMMHNGDSASAVAQNIGTYHIPTQAEFDALPKYGKNEYENAYKYRDSLQTTNPTQPANTAQPTQQTIPANNNPTTSNNNPTSENPTNGRERGYSTNVRTDSNMEQAIREVYDSDPDYYSQRRNAATLQKATEIFSTGIDNAEKTLRNAIAEAKSGRKLAPEMVPLSRLVANELARNGRVDSARAILSDIGAELTAAGQLGQAASILRGTDPITKADTIRKMVDKLNSQLTKGQQRKNVKRGNGDATGNIVVDQSLLDAYVNAATAEESNAALDNIKQNIADQLPATFAEKFTALRYLNMLGNFKTQGRNVFGNIFMGAAALAKRKVQAVTELAAALATGGKYQRNTTVGFSPKLYKSARTYFDTVADEVMGDAKYSDASRQTFKDIQDKRETFRNPLLRGYQKATNRAMEVGDRIFLRFHYADTMAGWMKAHGITDFNNATEEQLQQAHEFAMKEAQEATFRDKNRISELVTTFDKNWTPEAKALAQGILPFRQTPANVVVRAVEYSPLGIVGAVTNAAKGGNAADVINSISKSATGSALAVAGYLMAAAGMARGREDDDELDNFQKQQGQSDYSIKIGDLYVSLSQFAPMSIPFFMGVNLQETLEDQEQFDMNAVKAILTAISESMIEQSTLSGINDALSDLSGADGAAITNMLLNAAVSYLTQGITNSLLGQFEQANEKNRQTNYSTKDSFLDASSQYKLGKTLAKIPGIDYNQQDYVDAWGRTQSNGGAAERYINALINPTYYSKNRTTEVDKELERIYTANKDIGGFPDVLPQKASRSLEYARGKTMTPDEYLQYSKDRGQKSLELVKQFMDSKEYKKMNDRQRAEVISDLYSFAADRALKTVKTKHNVEYTGKYDDEAKLKNLPEYLAIKQTVSDRYTAKGENVPTGKKGFAEYANAGLNDSDLKTLSGEMLSEKQKKAYDILLEVSKSPKEAINTYIKIDADGNGSYKQPEVAQYLYGLDLPADAKQKLWENMLSQYNENSITYEKYVKKNKRELEKAQ